MMQAVFDVVLDFNVNNLTPYKYIVTNHDGFYCSGFTANQAQALKDQLNAYVDIINNQSLELSRLGGGQTEED